MKGARTGYYVALGLFTALMLFSVFGYMFQNETMQGNFISLGFPTFLIYPLAIAKLLGLVAIWTKQSVVLKEWAYAGFTFNIILAALAHLSAGDGSAAGALVALLLILTAYFLEKKIFPHRTVESQNRTAQVA